MVHAPYRVIPIVACEGEVRHIQEGGGRNVGQYPEGGNASVACKVDPTKPGYLTFDRGGLSRINLRIFDQKSDPNKSPGGESNKST